MTGLRKFIAGVGFLVIVYFFVSLFLYFSYWGIGIGLVLLVIIALIVAVAIVILYVISHARKIHKGLLWISRRLAKSETAQRIESFFSKRMPHMYRTIGGVFDITTMPGMFLLLGVIACAFFLALFFEVAGDTFFYSQLLAADPRIIYLFRTLVSGEATTFFVFVENLATVRMLLVLLLGVSLFLTIVKQYRWNLYFAAILVTGSIMTYGIKLIFQRPRPINLNYIALPNDPSFPSGHAVMAVCAYGFIAYMMVRSIRSRSIRIVTILAFFTLILLIGISRIYLGVHYPSDVFAGWYLGLAILSLFIAFAEIDIRSKIKRSHEQRQLSRVVRFGSVLVLLLVFVVAAVKTYRQIIVLYPREAISTVASVDSFLQGADKYSETLVGDRMAPISFIVVGSQWQLETLFQKAGWHQAEAPTFTKVLKLASAISKKKPYPTAPMTPAFYLGRTNDLGFQKPAEQNSARERHHTRYWHAGTQIGSQDIWVATASFDERVGLGLAINVPTHRIDPNIDAEREYIFSDLEKTGLIASFKKIDLVGPVHGVNASGDPFFTDGWAYTLYLQ